MRKFEIYTDSQRDCELSMCVCYLRCHFNYVFNLYIFAPIKKQAVCVVYLVRMIFASSCVVLVRLNQMNKKKQAKKKQVPLDIAE